MVPRPVLSFVDDLPAIRRHFNARVKVQSAVDDPINAIIIGFHLDQIGTLLLYFETGDTESTGGNWSLHTDKHGIELAHWPEALQSAREYGGSFVMPSGERMTLNADVSEQEVAKIFVRALLDVTLDAVARGTFAQLSLSRDCVLIVEEYDCLWNFPQMAEDENRLRMLPAVRLPE